ncbi:MAG: Stealth CR1 domain-containing protein, partial [Prevotella stercorea]|nr:stealth family protein [Prevotella sp.]MDD6940055.1 Stealth CR1 domain-containing protein [Leyella stercorea]MCI6490259.1 stealth family protein [Prevotella sp.]MCI7199223.1 stealth family protein [Prevotella sp.]MDY2709165.1 Stealth CR1 domain-containing protein [Prevotella sp.]
MDIDLVYLWVNGNDPKWIAKRNACIGRPSGGQAHCKGRYADSGELKYSLRSVEKYAPWIRRIFIVTDNQTPEWLNTDNQKVQIVDHKQIMPAECLPCFNSAVIEQFIGNIPGLSEHFLYANDDMYFGKPVQPQDFFGKDNLPKVFLFRKPLRKLALFYREKILGKKLNPYLNTIKNAAVLVEKRYGKYYGGKQHHNIDAYLKSTFELVNKEFENELREMRTHHMRSSDDIQRCIYSYVALAEKRAHLCYVSKRHSFRIQIENRSLYETFKQYNPKLFCMNDSERAKDEDRAFAINFISSLFPVKSEFEK